MRLLWDQVGQRTYETGVDHGVLYIPNLAGLYTNGVAWNGLTAVTESPTGAEANPQYADNMKYLNLFSAEEFGGTLEAFTYPDEFAPFDGLAVPTPGVALSQQNRGRFGLCYRTKKGNDVAGDDFGYKLHLAYGCSASPSEKGYHTVNDSPEAIAFSWALTTVPVAVATLINGRQPKPTSLLTVDSSQVDADALAALEDILYGTAGVDPRLPLPDEVIALFAGTVTAVTPAVPTYNNATHTITVPATAGVTYFDNNTGAALAAGAYVITEDTVISAQPNPGNEFAPGVDNDWGFDYV